MTAENVASYHTISNYSNLELLHPTPQQSLPIPTYLPSKKISKSCPYAVPSQSRVSGPSCVRQQSALTLIGDKIENSIVIKIIDVKGFIFIYYSFCFRFWVDSWFYFRCPQSISKISFIFRFKKLLLSVDLGIGTSVVPRSISWKNQQSLASLGPWQSVRNISTQYSFLGNLSDIERPVSAMLF